MYAIELVHAVDQGATGIGDLDSFKWICCVGRVWGSRRRAVGSHSQQPMWQVCVRLDFGGVAGGGSPPASEHPEGIIIEDQTGIQQGGELAHASVFNSQPGTGSGVARYIRFRLFSCTIVCATLLRDASHLQRWRVAIY